MLLVPLIAILLLSLLLVPPGLIPRRHAAIIYGGIASAWLLLMVMVIQAADAELLDVPSQWLVVAAIPLILALVTGGYIRRFRGFGVELEARLDAPITTADVIVEAATTELPGAPKRSRQRLEQMSRAQRHSVRRLTFRTGTRGYSAEVTEEYFLALPELQFVEIARPDRTFVCLLPISEFRPSKRKCNEESIDRLLRAIAEDNVPRQFDEAIVVAVSTTDTVIEALVSMRTSRRLLCPVVDSEQRFRGVAYAQEIERRIANDVIATRSRRPA